MKQDPDIVELLFHGCQRAYQMAMQAELSARKVEGVGGGVPMLLTLLRYREGAESPTQRELADALQISPAAIAMSLKGLEKLGYVERSPDPDDQRRKHIVLTPLGAEAAQSCLQAVSTVNRRMLAGFAEEERTQLAGYQHRMMRNLYGGWPELLEEPFERMECQCSKP